LFGPDASAIKVLHEGADRPQFEIPFEDRTNGLDLLGHDRELLVDAGIAKGNWPTHPYSSLAFGGGNLLAHPFPDHLAFELGEGQEWEG
jgi:hypothetical protein